MPLHTLHGQQPIVIAHRGASGYFPEHTEAAYRRAIELGADAVEPDLVMTRDGALVVRHDRYLSTSTDVSIHPEFAGRRVGKEGLEKPDWYAEDFTLAELKTLRCRQPFPGRSTEFDGRYPILTFEELLRILREGEETRGAPIGFHPEIKHPDHLLTLGLDFIPPLLRALAGFGLDRPRPSLFVQSFDQAFLRRLRPLTEVQLTQLLEEKDGGPHVTVESAAELAAAIGPKKSLLRDTPTGCSTGLIEQAHELGLRVHPWTFRDDAVGPGFRDVRAEMLAFFALGIDGAFSDFADTALAVRNEFVASL